MSERIRLIDDFSVLPRAPWRELTQGRPGLHLELLNALAGSESKPMQLEAFLLEDANGLVAAAVCRRISAALDRNDLDACLFGRGAKIAGTIGCSTRPLLFFSQPLLAGCPVAVRPGTPPATARRILARLLDEVESSAAARGFGIAFRGMTHDDEALIAELQARRYLETEGAPTTRLDVQWQDLDGYIAYLRKRSRSAASKARYEIRKNRDSGVVIRRLPLETGHLRRLNAIVRAHYLRKNGEDPGYPEELFLRLAEGLPEDFIIFEARRGDHVLGMASLVRSGTVAWASWMGMVECDEQQDFTYFNLCYYHLAEQAAALGIRRVLYGTTAYGAKRQRGCEIVVNPVHYRPHATLTRVLARPYVRFHRAWYRRKFP